MLLAMLSFVAQVTAPPSPPPPSESPTPAVSAPPSPLPGATISPSPSPSPSPTGSLSPISASPVSVAMTPAQQQVIKISGAVSPIAASSDRRLVSYLVDQTAQTITVTATQATGSDTLHVSDSRGAQVDVPLRVAFYAGTVAKTATLKVTGSPADPAWLAQQVASLVARLTTALPGAQTAIAAVTPAPSPLPAGAQTQYTVPVQINGGNNYFDVNDTTTVNVQNVDTGSFLPQFLFYDDDPERVNADGVLYRGTIDTTRPVRLYYYHDDGAQPRRIVVVLSPQTQDPSSVQIIDSSAGPNIDVMSVGHASTKNFLAYKPRNQGIIVDLNGAPFVLHDLPMTYRQGVAGTVGLRLLSGGPVAVTVLAASPGVDPLTLLQSPQLPDDGHHRTGVFSLTDYGNAKLSYTVGGVDAKFVYGDREPTPQNIVADSPGRDYGDYGVLWNIDFTLANPTAVPATVFLYERPIGGVLRSSFLVDNNLIDMGCVRVSKAYEIGAFTLQPNQTYRMNVQTMTDGGSNFPAEIGVTPNTPQPSPPPISAPDGCFPKRMPAASPPPAASPSPQVSPSPPVETSPLPSP